MVSKRGGVDASSERLTANKYPYLNLRIKVPIVVSADDHNRTGLHKTRTALSLFGHPSISSARRAQC